MYDISDFKYALRLLKKSPGFTLTTILVLAGGLAISIYTYSLLNTMLYKALPVEEGQSVVRIMGKQEGRMVSIGAFELSQMRADTTSLSEVGVYNDAPALLSDDDSSRSINTTYAEWNIFEFTRTQPLLGRGFVRGDNVEGAEPVVVLSHKIWQSVFAGDPDVIDRVVRVNRKPTRVVGVMPQGYSFPVGAGIWLPLSDREMTPTGYSQETLNAYARLRRGYSEGDAAVELDAQLQRIQQEYPRANPEVENLDGVSVASFQIAQTGPEGGYVFAILNVVSLFILLLACVNVGNMLLARTNERIKEIAIRVALGAPRLRLMIQMMLESVIICVVGGLAALLLAGWVLGATNRFMNSTFEGDLPFWWNWSLDSGAVFAAGAFILLSIFLVSALPTYSATFVNSNALLRDGTRGARGRTSGRISRGLVIVEIVLISVVMLVGSAMAIIAYRTAHIDFGMDTTNLSVMPLDLADESYDTPEEQLLFYQRLLTELRRNSEVDAAMVSGEIGEFEFAVDDVEYLTISDYPKATLVVVSETPVEIGTKLLEGRRFDSRDNETGLKSVVISRSLADSYWPDASALGRRIRLVDQAGKAQEQRIVVGVVSDVRRGENLFTTDKSTYAALYVPLPQQIEPATNILVRHRGNERAAHSAMHQAVESIDPYIVPGSIRSYGAMQEKLTLMATTMTDLFIRCGIFAILLAMTGIYGLSSNAVVQRTNEIGLRRAVGATDGNIITLFLKQGSRQLTAGFLISALISVVILFFISKFVGIGAMTLVFLGLLVAAVVSALVLLAIYVSTRRAVRYEPNVALRCE